MQRRAFADAERNAAHLTRWPEPNGAGSGPATLGSLELVGFFGFGGGFSFRVCWGVPTVRTTPRAFDRFLHEFLSVFVDLTSLLFSGVGQFVGHLPCGEVANSIWGGFW